MADHHQQPAGGNYWCQQADTVRESANFGYNQLCVNSVVATATRETSATPSEAIDTLDSGSNSNNNERATTTTQQSPSPPQRLVWRRRDHEPTTTEGSLRALLNKLAPSDSLGSLARQVAGHLREDPDEAPDELARQLVERSQVEPGFAATYARLCVLLVRARNGFVFYRQLMCRCRAAFADGLQSTMMTMNSCSGSSNISQQQQHCFYVTSTTNNVINNRSMLQQHLASTATCQQQQQQDIDNSGSSSSSSSTSSSSGLPSGMPSRADLQRHHLRALVAFVCQLFAEELLTFDALHADFLAPLERQLPAEVAVECVCGALQSAGAHLDAHRPQWVASVLRHLQTPDTVRALSPKLRLLFMVQDVAELRQRNWTRRSGSEQLHHQQPINSSAARVLLLRDQAEP